MKKEGRGYSIKKGPEETISIVTELFINGK